MTDKPIKPDPKCKPERPADANQRAKMIVDLATDAEQGDDEKQTPSPRSRQQKSTDDQT